MAGYRRTGPPDLRETFSLVVRNITYDTTAKNLYRLFDRYGRVIDIHIPRFRRTGESKGYGFVRYKYEDEAQRAIERLNGRDVDGRTMNVQFAQYDRNGDRIRKGRIEAGYGRGRDNSPPTRHDDDERERNYRDNSPQRYDEEERERSYRERNRKRRRSRTPDGRREKPKHRRFDRSNEDRQRRDRQSREGRSRSRSPPQRWPDEAGEAGSRCGDDSP